MEVVELVIEHGEQFRDDFGAWLLDNWHVWLAFERRATRLWQAGAKHAGARMIGEVLRYFTAIRQKGDDLKLNDHYWPDLARLWMEVYPSRKGFFETRVSKHAARTA